MFVLREIGRPFLRLGFSTGWQPAVYINMRAHPLDATTARHRAVEGLFRTYMEHRPDVPVCWWAGSLLWLSTALPPPQFMDVPTLATHQDRAAAVILSA